ncbi:serine/threonine-protein kinase [Cellulomonas massiliensis]|uniref:serine/threonine-protein kinase n=1 Tax=Cellulomonas massiliensis TaxID=1465811 RepID=UPI000309F247|nr:serine/threonine-protein kinase [Cellulomonas massiliensis]
MERIGLTPGSEIGGYTIVAPLGSGGAGAVYRAVDGGGDAVALKLLHPAIGADSEARERLRREVAALQRLRQPGVVRVLDAEADSSEAFLVTELVEGSTLTEHVRRRGPLPADHLLVLAEKLYAALDAVHAAGVVHRDVKPSNVMVTAKGPVLIDFGIAQSAGDERVTSHGLVMGTPGYLAPELLEGQEPTPSSDVWGWAAVLAFAATGRQPFGSRPDAAVLARSRAGDVDLDGVGALTARALRGALAPDPDGRTPPEDVVAALTVAARDGDLPPEDDEDRTEAVAGPGAAPAVVAPTARFAPRDGRTRAFEADGATPTVVVTEDDEPDEDGPTPAAATPGRGLDVIADDLDASEGPDDDEGPLYERPVAAYRRVSVLALGLAAACLAALYPVVTWVVVGLLLVVARTVGLVVESLHSRRERVGVRRGDSALAAAAGPWYLVRALLGLVPSLLVAASVVVIGLGLVWWLVDGGSLVLGDLATGDPLTGAHASVLLGVASGVGLLLVWFGPLSAMTRIGARHVLAAVTPGRWARVGLVVACLVVVLVVVLAVRTGATVHWTPLDTPVIP